MSSTKTVREEMDRLEMLNKDTVWCKYNSADYAPLYHSLSLIENKNMTLDNFYKLHPYYNPDYTTDYFTNEHNKWKEIWKQDEV